MRGRWLAVLVVGGLAAGTALWATGNGDHQRDVRVLVNSWAEATALVDEAEAVIDRFEERATEGDDLDYRDDLTAVGEELAGRLGVLERNVGGLSFDDVQLRITQRTMHMVLADRSRQAAQRAPRLSSVSGFEWEPATSVAANRVRDLVAAIEGAWRVVSVAQTPGLRSAVDALKKLARPLDSAVRGRLLMHAPYAEILDLESGQRTLYHRGIYDTTTITLPGATLIPGALGYDVFWAYGGMEAWPVDPDDAWSLHPSTDRTVVSVDGVFGVIATSSTYHVGIPPPPERVRRVGVEGQLEGATKFGVVVRQGYGLRFGPGCGAGAVCFQRMDRRLLFVRGEERRQYFSQRCTKFVATKGTSLIWRECHDGPGVTLKITNATSWDTRSLRVEPQGPVRLTSVDPSAVSPNGRYIANVGLRRAAFLDLRSGQTWVSPVEARNRVLAPNAAVWSNDSRHLFYVTSQGNIAVWTPGEARPDVIRNVQLDDEEGWLVAALPPAS